jgi:hypothetical protein
VMTKPPRSSFPGTPLSWRRRSPSRHAVRPLLSAKRGRLEADKFGTEHRGDPLRHGFDLTAHHMPSRQQPARTAGADDVESSVDLCAKASSSPLSWVFVGSDALPEGWSDGVAAGPSDPPSARAVGRLAGAGLVGQRPRRCPARGRSAQPVAGR